jgi:hypothetical protein
MGNESPEWVAIIVAVVALTGVLAGQSITLYNERARRKTEQTKLVREEVHAAMMSFFVFSSFAQDYYPKRNNQYDTDNLSEQWRKAADKLAAQVANMAGRGHHRATALDLMDGLGMQPLAWEMGEGIGTIPKYGYMRLSWEGFEVVGAWLRGERIPRRTRRLVRKVRRMRKRIFAESAHRRRLEDDTHRSGVLRVAGRRARVATKRLAIKIVVRPSVRMWTKLMAP